MLNSPCLLLTVALAAAAAAAAAADDAEQLLEDLGLCYVLMGADCCFW